VPRIRLVSEAAGINVVVATGVYAFLELPNFLGYRSAEAIAEIFVREIREGIDDTGIKAAFIKCAVERFGLVGHVPKILAAVALASNETGAPVMVHTNAAARTGTLALDALMNEGVDPARIVIAHCGDCNDLEYLRAIAATGAILGCDRFGIDHFNPLADRIDTLAALLEEGYASQIHLGHDAACFLDFFTGDPNFANEKPDYLLISRTVLPALRERGIGDDLIDRMLLENPQRFFSAAPVSA
jgi:phosphotriesterase-related protein